MGRNRSELRKIIMTILYQMNLFEKNKMEYDTKSLIRENIEIENEFVNEIVFGVIEKKEMLNQKANQYMNGWTIDRLGYPDQAILQLALYELLYTDTPSVVCINEAIELAKLYSDDEVRKMINGILDKIYHEMEAI